METVRLVILIAAVLCTGLLAGLMYGFSVAVMPGLARSDDTAFVQVMQKINIAIGNPWFVISFGGAFVFTLVALLLHFGRPALPWLIVALTLNVVGYLITFLGNIPLNGRLAAAGTVDGSTAASVRTAFEARWVRWNISRTVAHALALISLAAALALPGR